MSNIVYRIGTIPLNVNVKSSYSGKEYPLHIEIEYDIKINHFKFIVPYPYGYSSKYTKEINGPIIILVIRVTHEKKDKGNTALSIDLFNSNYYKVTILSPYEKTAFENLGKKVLCQACYYLDKRLSLPDDTKIRLTAFAYLAYKKIEYKDNYCEWLGMDVLDYLRKNGVTVECDGLSEDDCLDHLSSLISKFLEDKSLYNQEEIEAEIERKKLTSKQKYRKWAALICEIEANRKLVDYYKSYGFEVVDEDDATMITMETNLKKVLTSCRQSIEEVAPRELNLEKSLELFTGKRARKNIPAQPADSLMEAVKNGDIDAVERFLNDPNELTINKNAALEEAAKRRYDPSGKNTPENQKLYNDIIDLIILDATVDQSLLDIYLTTLTSYQKKAIELYVYGAFDEEDTDGTMCYYILNKKLAKGSPLDIQEQFIYDHLISCFRYVRKPRVIYRGVQKGDVSEYVADLVGNGCKTIKTFMSTTTNPRTAFSFMRDSACCFMVITLDEYVKAMYINPTEDEILIAPNQEICLDEIKHEYGKNYIYCTIRPKRLIRAAKKGNVDMVESLLDEAPVEDKNEALKEAAINRYNPMNDNNTAEWQERYQKVIDLLLKDPLVNASILDIYLLDLTSSQIDAIGNYAWGKFDNGIPVYRALNTKLRERTNFNSEEQDVYDNLMSAFKTLTKPMVVYRGLKTQNTEEYIKDMFGNGCKKIASFLSSTINLDFALNFQGESTCCFMVITLQEGAKAMYINEEEDEVLIAPDQEICIDEVKSAYGKNYIYCSIRP